MTPAVVRGIVHFVYEGHFMIDKPLLIDTAQGSPFRCRKQSAINGSPGHSNVLKLQYT